MHFPTFLQDRLFVRSTRWWLALGLGTALAVASGCGTSDGTGDAGAGSSGGDSGPPLVDSGKCGDPEVGLGDPCDTSDDCSCDAVCELSACAAPVACDEVLLSWTAPVERGDRTCLPSDELGGFSIHWSVNEEAIGTDEATVEDIGLPCITGEEVPCGVEGETVPQVHCSHRLTDLPQGEVFLALAAHAADGSQSELSEVVRKIIDCE